MTDPRAILAHRFLTRLDWQHARRAVLAGDASNRRYDRLWRGDQPAVLMDASPDKGEDTRPFVTIAQALCDLGLSAPKVIGSDAENGFLLLEDLGDDLFARVVDRSPSQEALLYGAAMTALVHLHSAPPHPELSALANYDAATMAPLSALAYDWYLGETQAKNDDAKQRFMDIFDPILAKYAECDVTILRDFHAENLLWLPDRQGVERVGLLDFQDAMRGGRAYDVVSLLMDARRDVSPKVQQEMIALYCAQSGCDRAEFEAQYHVLGAQRNLRILGVFARLSRRDGKKHYVDMIPRVWDHLMINLDHDALAPVSAVIQQDLPRPTPALLDRLRR